MKTTIAKNGQVVIPFKVRKALKLEPGAVLAVSLEGSTIIMEQMRPPPPPKPDPVKFIKKNGLLVAVTKRRVSPEQIQALLADFP